MSNKKVLALILTAVMSVSCLTACGQEVSEEKESGTETSTSENISVEEPSSEEVAELEPVTLKWYVMDKSEKEGTADVIEAFNEKLAEVLPNTTVEFVFVSDYKTQWPLLIAGEEKMDIAWSGWSTPFEQDVIDGNVMDITNLIDEYAPNLVEEMEIWQNAYASCSKDGKVYGIPCIQPVVKEAQQFVYSPELEPYLDLEAMEAEFRTNNKLTSKMLDIMEEAYQAAIDDGVLKVGDVSWNIEGNAASALLGYLPLGPKANYIFYDPEAENIVPMYAWEVPEYRMAVERFAKWYDLGWITETQVLGQLPADSKDTMCISNDYNANWSGCDENGIKIFDSNGRKTMMTNTPEEGYVGVTVFGSESSYQVIPYTCENPERAIMLLNVLHDEAGTVGNDLMNMLCYGFEKNSEEAEEYGWYNYEAVEKDGQLEVTIEEGVESKHSMTNWAMGNTFKIMHDGGVLTTTAAKEYALNFYEEIYPKLKKTPVSGMIVDYSGLQMEMDALATVKNEFDGQLSWGSCGADEVDELFEEALSKLEEAGLNKVKEELQAQIDAYVNK